MGEDSAHGLWLASAETVDGRPKYTHGSGRIEWNSVEREWQMFFLDKPIKYRPKVDSEEVPQSGWELQEAMPLTFGHHEDKRIVAYCAERACESTE